MRNFSKKIIALILCAAMIFCALPMGAQAAEETEYTLYPTPHEITYAEGSYELKDINVIYGTGMDDATKARLEETAALRSLSVTVSDAADSAKTNVYVAIYGSGDAVEGYITTNYTVDATLFAKTDANFVASNNGEIVVLGKDVDSCFYGLTTLYQIFGQLVENSLRNFTISDYADVVSRGFIEGYYGNPWSTEDRINLMTWGGYYKLNSYFYAPKDDPKHNSNWRELYTAEEIETLIKPLAEAGNASKCRFVYALHPYMYNAIRYTSEEAYQQDLAIMQAKFRQVIDAGVRQIAILADDATNVGSDNYIRTLNDMVAWLKDLQKVYPDLKTTLPFCTQEYMGNGQSYYASFPEDVQIIMTGGKVWGEVSNSFTTTFTNTAGRGPYMWINWPCTDNSKNHLIMGGYTTFLQAGVDPSNIQGIVLNPMQQSEPSKIAIFGNACYSWNIWADEDEANAAYEVSFAAADHNTVVPNAASNALKELSKHMINQNMDSRVTALQESVKLRESLTSLKAKLDAGTYTAEEVAAVRAEFVKLQEAAKVYREQGNTAIVGQIVYWLDCWDDTTAAILNYLDALTATSDADAWSYYSAGQAAYESSLNHPLWYMTEYVYAEVGVQHIVPFMVKLGQVLASKMATIVNPTDITVTYITNRTDKPATGSVINVTDGNDSTNAVYQNPNKILEGDYVGLLFSGVMDVENIHIVLGAGKDHFDEGKLQYTMDGATWTDLELVGMDNSFTGAQNVVQEVNVAKENLPANFEAKGIRFIATADNAQDAWLEVREVAVNVETAEEEEGSSINYSVIKSSDWTIYSGSESSLYDGSDSSYVWYNPGNSDTAIVDSYVGYDFGESITIGSIYLVVGNDGADKFVNYTLETSSDGNTWTAIPDYANYTGVESGKDTLNITLEDPVDARYIRVRNLAARAKWVKFSEFTVAPPSEGDTENIYTNTSLDIKSIYTDAETIMVPASGLTLEPGDYIGLDLGRIKDLATITVSGQGGLTLQVSKNAYDWTTVSAGSTDEDARYVRLINNTEEDVTVSITEFTVTSNEVTTPTLYDSDIDINSSWGVSEDSRNNGQAFDGDVTTETEFADLPQQGQYIIYDLGQERNIYKLEIYCADTALNYIRDAEVYISNDLTAWTKILTIGDGVENTDDGQITCINSDAGYSQSTSSYPNYPSIEGELDEAQPARYIKILMTATNNNRAVVFNEIEINEGEYVSPFNDPTFSSTAIEAKGYAPQNMIDGDLTTSYKPNTTEAGSIEYTFSDNLTANCINIAQKTVSNAKVSLLVQKDDTREWVSMGTLSESLVKLTFDYDLVLALKIEWEAGSTPNISEIARFTA